MIINAKKSEEPKFMNKIDLFNPIDSMDLMIMLIF